MDGVGIHGALRTDGPTLREELANYYLAAITTMDEPQARRLTQVGASPASEHCHTRPSSGARPTGASEGIVDGSADVGGDNSLQTASPSTVVADAFDVVLPPPSSTEAARVLADAFDVLLPPPLGGWEGTEVATKLNDEKRVAVARAAAAAAKKADEDAAAAAAKKANEEAAVAAAVQKAAEEEAAVAKKAKEDEEAAAAAAKKAEEEAVATAAAKKAKKAEEDTTKDTMDAKERSPVTVDTRPATDVTKDLRAATVAQPNEAAIQALMKSMQEQIDALTKQIPNVAKGRAKSAPRSELAARYPKEERPSLYLELVETRKTDSPMTSTRRNLHSEVYELGPTPKSLVELGLYLRDKFIATGPNLALNVERWDFLVFPDGRARGTSYKTRDCAAHKFKDGAVVILNAYTTGTARVHPMFAPSAQTSSPIAWPAYILRVSGTGTQEIVDAPTASKLSKGFNLIIDMLKSLGVGFREGDYFSECTRKRSANTLSMGVKKRIIGVSLNCLDGMTKPMVVLLASLYPSRWHAPRTSRLSTMCVGAGGYGFVGYLSKALVAVYCDVPEPRGTAEGGGGFTLPPPAFLGPAALATLRSWARGKKDLQEQDMNKASVALDVFVEYLSLDQKWCPFKQRTEWAPIWRQVEEWAREGRAQVRKYKDRRNKNLEASTKRRQGLNIERPSNALIRVPINKSWSVHCRTGPLVRDLKAAAVNEPVLVTDIHMLHLLSDAVVVRAWGAESGQRVRKERQNFRKKLVAGLPFPAMLFRMPRGAHGYRETSEWYMWRVCYTHPTRQPWVTAARPWPQPLALDDEANFWAAHRAIEDTLLASVATTAPRVLMTRLLVKLRAAGARPALVEAVLNDHECRPRLHDVKGCNY